MKKVFANWKMSLTALLLMGSLMLVSNGAQAQGNTLSSNPGTADDVKGAGTWAIEADALLLLEIELQGPITQALEQLPNGSGQFYVWKYKATLYEAVHASIQQGIPVSKAVRANYDRMAGAPHMEPVISVLSQSEWQTIFNELVDLLTI